MSNHSRDFAPTAAWMFTSAFVLTLGVLIGCNSAPLDADEGLKNALLLGVNGGDCDSNGIPDEIDLTEGDATD